MTMGDANVTIANLQAEICDYLGLEAEHVLFDFEEDNTATNLAVITINRVHNQSFLFHKEQGNSKIDALEQVKEYAIRHSNQENSYTIQWMKVGEGELHTSYFRAKGMQGVLDKFHHGRDALAFKIFSITMNPIS